jgi:hypothetical protein
MVLAQDSSGGVGGGATGTSGSSTDKLAQFQQSLGSASAATNSSNFFASSQYNQYSVYMGGTIGGQKTKGSILGTTQGGALGPSLGVQKGDLSNYNKMSYGDAIMAPVNSWTSDQVREFVNKGIVNKIPGFEVGMGMPQIQAAWQSQVEASILFNQGLKEGQKPWTPYDVMDTWSNNKGKYGTQRQGDWIFDVATGERIKYVGPTSKTTTSKHVDLSSAADVKALATQALRELLGRAPTAKEMAQFRASITSEEKANPTVTTTTQQLSPDLATGSLDVTDESSTTTGGVSDAARAALIQAPTEQTKEYGKYQSGTTYWDAMMQMIAGSG